MGEQTVITHSDAYAQGHPVEHHGRDEGGPTETEKGSYSPDVKDEKDDH
jgi:hypothetical protein